MTNRMLGVGVLLALTTAQGWSESPALKEKAPEFSLTSLEGGTIKLSEEYAKSPVVLILLRGFPGYQCPVCNKQVHDLIKAAPEFASLGVSVLMVYPGGPADLAARAKDFTADKNLPANFRLLLDPGYEFTNRYGLRWDAPNETAYPATFLIDKQGSIFFRKISKTHGGRTTAAEIIAVLNNRVGR
jgi:peroxiredoxin